MIQLPVLVMIVKKVFVESALIKLFREASLVLLDAKETFLNIREPIEKIEKCWKNQNLNVILETVLTKIFMRKQTSI